MNSASSWATVEAIEELIGKTFEIPPKDRWITASDSTADINVPKDLRRWFPNPNKALIQEAVPRSMYERREIGDNNEVRPLLDDSSKLMRELPALIPSMHEQRLTASGENPGHNWRTVPDCYAKR